MIGGFLETWDLFAESYLAAWSMALLLAPLGVLLVARDQVFLGAALSQASTLGIAVATVAFGAGHAHHGSDELRILAAAVGASLLAVGLIRLFSGRGHESEESVTGLLFLGCAAASVLVVSGHAHGGEQVERLMASSLIGAGWSDVGMLAGMGAAVLVAMTLFHRTLLLVVIDPLAARVQGVASGRWRVGLDLVVAVAAALSLHCAGLLYTLGCLVLPAMIARNLCRTVAAMLVTAPLVALAASMIACVVAHERDLPPAQAAVAAMAIGWAVSAAVRPLKG